MDLVSFFAALLVPLTLGVAIVRRRLFDVDLLINRALVNGLLTSTLVIAALFNSLRRRIQYFIDRRFYRRKYDAARTLEAYARGPREETDLEQLSGTLISVVEKTVQSGHVSLWLREQDRGRQQ